MTSLPTISRMAMLLYALAFLLPSSTARAQSFAPAPPQTDAVKELYEKTIHLEPSAQGRPLPSNDWWTSLLANAPFPGKMYAEPFTVSADAGAVKVWLPTGWNESGTALVPGAPLDIEPILLTPNANPAERVLFDFESDWATMGWTLRREAFGKAPMNNTQHPSRNVVGRQFAASFHQGDSGIGAAISPEFKVTKPWLHFKIAGGSDKETLGVHLSVDGRSVRQAVGKNNNDFAWMSWDLRPFLGKTARVVLADQSKGGWGFISADHFVISDNKALPKSGAFSHASTVDWGDWHVVMRLHASATQFVDVTFGRGMPYVWLEPKGLQLKIPGELSADGRLSFNGDERRSFGIHAPGGTLTAANGHTVFEGPLLAISAVGSAVESVTTFAKYAAAIPRKTLYDWTYEPTRGGVATTWIIQTANEAEGLQGWIPHHVRTTEHDLRFVGIDYASRRGKLQLASGTRFQIVWPFTGIVPAYPLPDSEDDAFDPARLAGLIESWADEKLKKPPSNRQAKDTYWGGKSMLKTAQAMTMATQLEGLEDFDESGQLGLSEKLLTESKRVTADWLTHTPGEEAFHYARYPAPWNGLVGFLPSFGSEKFTDNHFHYGYLAMSAALIGIHDPAWLTEYGPAAREVVRQYADWTRKAPDFPRLRTFECWAGHSYAGGMSSMGDGNNQESSSEAIGAWAAMFFLGAVLNDQEMLATGAMGYAIETEAVHEYWNNAYGWKDAAASNWSPRYKPTICSVMRDRDMGAWTWFSGEPIHIYGIQWLPAWTHLHYFGAPREHSAFQLDQMLARQGKHKGKGTLSWEDLDDDWGQVTTAYAAFSRPGEVCTALEKAFENNWRIAGHKHAGIPYYLAHANRSFGLIDTEFHTDLPTSLVVKKDGRRTAFLYNLAATPKTVTIYRKGERVTETLVAPKQLVAFPIRR